MSRHPDPCYCEQACAYEELLEEVLRVLKKNRPHNQFFKELEQKIETTVNDYKDAQAEYAEED